MPIAHLTPDLEVLLRLGLAVLCGVAVGLNRAHHGTFPHPNRLRVHVLVGLSACLMVLAAGHGADARSRAIQLAKFWWALPGAGTNPPKCAGSAARPRSGSPLPWG
jgi:putative Mg2+ transporter-C (MgtC) family protein